MVFSDLEWPKKLMTKLVLLIPEDVEKSEKTNNMVSAMEAVKAGQFTNTAAASRFSVPRKTLDDRIKLKVTHGSKPQPSLTLKKTPSYLTLSI